MSTHGPYISVLNHVVVFFKGVVVEGRTAKENAFLPVKNDTHHELERYALCGGVCLLIFPIAEMRSYASRKRTPHTININTHFLTTTYNDDCADRLRGGAHFFGPTKTNVEYVVKQRALKSGHNRFDTHSMIAYSTNTLFLCTLHSAGNVPRRAFWGVGGILGYVEWVE